MLCAGRTKIDSLNDRAHEPEAMSKRGWTSRCAGSWNVSVKLLPMCAYWMSNSRRSVRTCWSLSSTSAFWPVSHPDVPYALPTATWRYAVSMRRVSDASRALRTFSRPGVLEVELVVADRRPAHLVVVVVERRQVGREAVADRFGAAERRWQSGQPGRRRDGTPVSACRS